MKLPPIGQYSAQFFVMALIMIVMPFYYRFLPPGVYLAGILWLLAKAPDFRFSASREQKTILVIFSLYFLWQVVTLLYTEDLPEGWHNITARLSLVVFPLVLFDPDKDIAARKSLLLRLFAFSAALYMLFCFGVALERSISVIDGRLIFNPITPEAKWLNYFYGSDLSLMINPTYMSVFVLISAFISFESARDFSFSTAARAGWIVLGMFHLVTVWFLSSRIGLVAAIIMTGVYIASVFFSGKPRYVLAGIVLIVLVGVPVVKQNPRMAFFLNRLSEHNYVPEGQDHRFTIWEIATGLAAEKPLTGYGIGDVMSELNEKLREEGVTETFRDSHNQFVQSMLEGGIVQLILLCVLLSMMLFIALRQGNILFGLFVVMMIIFLMTECMISRFFGAAFFSIFGVLLIDSAGPSNEH